ncbi:MAG: class I SAM-dependent methyltransferase [Bacteroidia bacterium]|nr:class I SAM-dependent methyltransferase [Bacteroidia bacterium]
MTGGVITEINRDPFGQAMRDYFRGNLSARVQVFSDLAEEDHIPVKYLFRSFSQMPEWEKRALEECRGKVLDIGAGAGSHALELQHSGLEVTALDISPGAVEIMRQRGVQKVVNANIWELSGERYDTLLMLMNGVGLVGDLKGLNKFLVFARSLLKPGGQLLLDSSDVAYLFESENAAPPNPVYYGIISYQMVYKNVLGETFDWLYVDFPRLTRHARAHGFHCELLLNGPHFEYLARLTPFEKKL